MKRHKPTVIAVLPSRDEEVTIGAVANCVEIVVRDFDAMLLNIDSSVTPATKAAFLGGERKVFRDSITSRRGKGWQVLEGLNRAGSADVVLLADTDVRNPSAHVYHSLIDAITAGADLAIAAYKRHWDEGNLTNHIMRPACCAVSGIDIHQPIAGDLAMSRRLVRAVIEAAKEREASPLMDCIGGYGIDGLIVGTASMAVKAGRIRSCEFASTKLHAPSFPHLPQIYCDTVPVVLQAVCRSKLQIGDWSGSFKLGQRTLSRAVFDEMRDTLVRQGAPLDGRLAQSWPQPLIEAINEVRSGTDAIRAAENLRPAYLARVMEYLRIGFFDGAEAAASTLEIAMHRFLSDLGVQS